MILTDFELTLILLDNIAFIFVNNLSVSMGKKTMKRITLVVNFRPVEGVCLMVSRHNPALVVHSYFRSIIIFRSVFIRFLFENTKYFLYISL